MNFIEYFKLKKEYKLIMLADKTIEFKSDSKFDN